MKLRLYGDSVRVRLSRSEVERLGHGEAVEGVTRLSANQSVECRVESAEIGIVRAEFTQGREGVALIVSLPRDQARVWAGSLEEGIYGEQENGTGGVLTLAVEKDFVCLHSDDAAENQDAFPNPRESS